VTTVRATSGCSNTRLTIRELGPLFISVFNNNNFFYVRPPELYRRPLLLIIKIKRIYDNPKGDNNFRILVDGLWPRGLSKDKARMDLWQKDIAPSNSLRKWFGHDEKKWDEFKRKYFKELDKNNDTVNTIIKIAKEQNSITLLYGSKEERFNNAVALKEYLEEKIKK
jgi:uncharacterized protein YeaO (DUF488 family)